MVLGLKLVLPPGWTESGFLLCCPSEMKARPLQEEWREDTLYFLSSSLNIFTQVPSESSSGIWEVAYRAPPHACGHLIHTSTLQGGQHGY